MKTVQALLLTLLLGAGQAQAALVATSDGLGVYDTVNDITWTADGNLFATQAASFFGGAAAFVTAIRAASGNYIADMPNAYDTVPNSGLHRLSLADFYTPRGYLSWWGAKAWVNYLNSINYAGSNQWRLPTTVDSASLSTGFPDGGTGNPAPSSSQLAQLFYVGLGQVAGSSINSTHGSSYDLFTNIQSALYWSDTESSAVPERAWGFDPATGNQDAIVKGGRYYFALAVSPGQVSSVPVPGGAWLLSGCMLGLLGWRRRAA